MHKPLLDASLCLNVKRTTMHSLEARWGNNEYYMFNASIWNQWSTKSPRYLLKAGEAGRIYIPFTKSWRVISKFLLIFHYNYFVSPHYWKLSSAHINSTVLRYERYSPAVKPALFYSKQWSVQHSALCEGTVWMPARRKCYILNVAVHLKSCEALSLEWEYIIL